MEKYIREQIVEKQFVLAIDQGTTSSRAIIFDKDGEIISSAQKEFTQYFPKAGWVEHDADEIVRPILISSTDPMTVVNGLNIEQYLPVVETALTNVLGLNVLEKHISSVVEFLLSKYNVSEANLSDVVFEDENVDTEKKTKRIF